MNRLLTAGERRHQNVGKTAKQKAKRKAKRLTPRELKAALERRARRQKTV